MEQKVNPIPEAKQKRMAGFPESRDWEGVYRIERKDGRRVRCIDRSTVTRFLNRVSNSFICLSCGILLETTERLGKRETTQTD